MKRISPSKEKPSFWPGALFLEGRMWDETGLDGSVWPDLAGKRNPSSNRDDPDGFLAPEPAKTSQGGGKQQNKDLKNMVRPTGFGWKTADVDRRTTDAD